MTSALRHSGPGHGPGCVKDAVHAARHPEAVLGARQVGCHHVHSGELLRQRPLVHRHDDVRGLREELLHDVAADEPGAPRDEHGLAAVEPADSLTRPPARNTWS